MPDDQRGQNLAALIVERATIKRNQAEAIRDMRDTVKDLDKQIQRLAAEIESGQATLGLEGV